MLDHKVSKPSLLVRPSQPQIIVIPQSMFSNGGLKNIVSFTAGEHKGPVVTRVVRPQVAIVKKPVEVAPQPIAIKRPLPASSDSSDDDSKRSDSPSKIRKRANLDHLSQEEKLLRRKLKNRVAAQNARDKKKMRMDEMEVALRQFEDKISSLEKRNHQLMIENNKLRIENDRLRSQQGLDVKVYVKEEVESFPDSPLSEPPTSQSPFSSDIEDSPTFDGSYLLSPVSFCSEDTLSCEAASQCTSACDRPFEPAVPNKVLQLKGRGRSQTVEHVTAEQQDCLQRAESTQMTQWICPLKEVATLNPLRTSPLSKTFSETLTLPTQDPNLPLKKRNPCWDSHAKT